MKKLFFSLSVLCFSLIFSFGIFSPALANGFGTDETAKAAGLSEKFNQPVPVLVGNIIGAALSMIGVIFFILMIYGGFIWMTARGDDGMVTKAKDTIIAAVIGLTIVLGSYAITNFIFRSAESAPETPPVAAP